MLIRDLGSRRATLLKRLINGVCGGCTVETAEILVGAERERAAWQLVGDLRRKSRRLIAQIFQQVLVCDEVDLRFLDAESWT
jgi:hypothetical protein